MSFHRVSIAALVLLILGLPAVQASAEQEVSPAQVSDLASDLQRNLTSLTRMSQSIKAAPEHDREALEFRRDERSFRLLVQLDELMRASADLASDDPARRQVEALLTDELSGAGEAVLKRIVDIGGRIADLRTQIDTASGADMVALEAYLQSLETLRFRYYGALVAQLEAREELGLPDQGLVERLLPMLYLQGEAMVGRIEYTGGALQELNQRLSEDSGNADVAAARSDMARQQALDLSHLETMIDLLQRLGEEPDQYQSVLLQQGQGLSVAALDAGVVASLMHQAWAAMRSSVAEQAPDFLFKLVVFLVIVLLFRWLSRLVRKAVRTACDRSGEDMSQLLKDVLVSVCGSTVMVIGILIALAQVGISLGPMLAGLGVAGFVVGFALQDTLGNFAAGGMILIYRPYDVDDFVEVAGASGLVKKMSLVSTTIATYDNQTLVVPNSKIWGDVIKNVTAQKVRRVDLVFGIGYGDDIEHAQRVLEDVVESHEKTLAKPEPLIKVHELGDSSVNFAVRPWVKTEDYWTVYWDLTRDVKLRFDREGISIPFPQRDVHIYREDTA